MVPAVNIQLPDLPSALSDCPRPTAISGEIEPGGHIGEGRLIELWTRDRAAAVRCRNRLLELGSYYQTVRSDLSRIVEPE